MAHPNKISSRITDTPIKVGRKTFVGGLFWQALDTPRRPMQEAQKIAKRDSFDLVVIRKIGNTAQAGFIRSVRGVRAGAYSIAAVLASRLGRNFIGVFALDDGRFLLCAVRDGAVLPGCDVIGSAAEIHTKFLDSLDLSPSWDAIYLPAEFERPESLKAQESHLSKLLASRVPANTKLQSAQLRASGSLLVTLGCMACGVVAWWGYSQWNPHHQPAPTQGVEAPQAVATQSAPPIHPWSQQVRLQAFLDRCMAGIRTLPLSLAGWSFEQAQCRLDGSVLSAGYKRQGRATVRQFSDAARSHGFEVGATFSEGFNAASLALPLKWAPEEAADESILPSSDRQASFASNLQALGVSFKLQDTAPPPPALPGGTASQGNPTSPAVSQSNPSWQTFQWSFETTVSPVAILAAIDDKGVRITDLKVVMHANAAYPLAWSISGVMYAKP